MLTIRFRNQSIEKLLFDKIMNEIYNPNQLISDEKFFNYIKTAGYLEKSLVKKNFFKVVSTIPKKLIGQH